MTLSYLVLREVRRRPGRTTLTFFGIALGVAAAVSVALTTTATRRLYRDMFETLTGRAALEVVAEGFVGFAAAVASDIEKIDGVRGVFPIIQAPAALLTDQGTAPVLVLGIDPARDREVRDIKLRAGAYLDERDGILIEAPFALAQGLEPGDAVRLLGPGGFMATEVAGLLDPTGVGMFQGGSVVFLERRRAAQLLGLDDQVNCLQLVLEDGAAVDEVETRVAAVLPAGQRVQAPASRGRLARDSLLSTEQGLASLSIISLIAGAFIVLNTFHMNLAERRRQLAVLRAIGVTRRQVMGLLLREALLLGTAGTLVGLVLGVLFSFGMTRGMGDLLLMDLPGLQVTWEPLLTGLIVGIGTTLAATYLPARQAGRREPLEELCSHRRTDVGARPGPSVWVGVLLLAICAVVTTGFLCGWMPVDLITPTMAATLIGFVLILPLFLTPLLFLARRVLVPLFGVEGEVGLRILERQRGRTALTAGVLFVALIANVGSGSSIRASVRDLDEYFERTIVADYLVRSAMPDIGLLSAPAMPEDLDQEIARLPGAQSVEKLRFLPARVGDQPVIVMARTVAPDLPVHLDLHNVAPDEARARLRSGEVIAGTALIQRLGLEVGGTLTLATPSGDREVRIGGATTEYTAGGVILYMEWAAAQELLGVKGVDVFSIGAAGGKAAALEAPLRAFCDQRGLLLQSNADLRAAVDQMVRSILVSDWVILALVFVVASLGIINTLAMNVLEQTRELGTLRALGMLRRQLRRIVLSQALGLACVSIVPGLLVGLLVGYLMNLATLSLLGQPVEFRVDWVLLAVCLVVAVAVSLAAAFFPARRAAGLEVAVALQYE
ncbi:MAG: FtsX-like permease family protein [Planctomycetes bacterium]|nr:FtsX-like permease family protein [Planctomycetota bacterium]